jgi:hypothetical protein
MGTLTDTPSNSKPFSDKIIHTYKYPVAKLSFFNYLPNSIEKSPSSELDGNSACQEIPCLLWNLKVHYYAQKSQLILRLDLYKAVYLPGPHNKPCHKNSTYIYQLK